MAYTERFSEVHYPLTSEPSDAFTAGTDWASTYVSLQNYHRAVVVINVGDIAAGGLVDAEVLQATDTSGTGAKSLTTSKAITQLTQAGGDSGSLVCIEVRTEELDVTNGFDCIGLYTNVRSAQAELGFIIYGIEPRYPPTGTTNWAEVVT